MADDMSRRKKPCRKYLTNANVPTIPAPPPDASQYRIQTARNSTSLSPLLCLDINSPFGIQNNSSDSPSESTSSQPYISRLHDSESMATDPGSPDTLVEQPSPSFLSLNSPILLLSKDNPINFAHVAPSPSFPESTIIYAATN